MPSPGVQFSRAHMREGCKHSSPTSQPSPSVQSQPRLPIAHAPPVVPPLLAVGWSLKHPLDTAMPAINPIAHRRSDPATPGSSHDIERRARRYRACELCRAGGRHAGMIDPGSRGSVAGEDASAHAPPFTRSQALQSPRNPRTAGAARSRPPESSRACGCPRRCGRNQEHRIRGQLVQSAIADALRGHSARDGPGAFAHGPMGLPTRLRVAGVAGEPYEKACSLAWGSRPVPRCALSSVASTPPAPPR